LRLQPLEWHAHPGIRFEVYGWVPGEEPATESLSDQLCRLNFVSKQAGILKQSVELASSAAVERWRDAQRREEERNQKEQAEKTAVEQQLADTQKKLDELRQAHHLVEDQLAETEQKLIDANTEKLKLEVDKERSETQCASLDEKLAQANESITKEKEVVAGLEEKVSDLNAQAEDLQMQIGVLTEERDCARTREEELFDTLNAREEELMNTNEGYVYLSEQLHEVREDLEDKIDARDRLVNTLNERNQELCDEGLTLRKENGELKRKLGEAEKAVKDIAAGLPTRFTLTSNSFVNLEAAQKDNGYPEKKTKKEKKEESSAYTDDFDE